MRRTESRIPRRNFLQKTALLGAGILLATSSETSSQPPEGGKLTGQTAIRRKTVRVTETGKEIERTAADQVVAHGVFESGAAFSAHYRGGMSLGTNFLWEINGTAGDLQVTGNIGHGQFAELTIKGGKKDEKELAVLTPPAGWYEGLPEEVIPRNVAELHKLVAQDIRTGTRQAPRFEDGLRLHRLLDQVESPLKS